MKLKEFTVLGYKVNYNVTENSQEFNKLDTKRIDAANDEAVANIVYRSMNPDTRAWFIHGREAVEGKDGQPGVLAIVGFDDVVAGWYPDDPEMRRKEKPVNDKKTGKPKIVDGVAVTEWDETQEAYHDRVIAKLVEVHKKFTSEESARAYFLPAIQKIALEVPFDVEARVRTDRGPKKLAAMYKLAAAKALTRDLIDRINKLQLGVMEPAESFTPTGDMATLYTGKFPDKDKTGAEVQVEFSVSDKDAEALGWSLKRYFDWKRSQEMNEVVA